jgi:hypothetical protein
MASFSEIYKTMRDRMTFLRIDLAKFVAEEVETFEKSPIGFAFKSGNLADFECVIANSLYFGKEHDLIRALSAVRGEARVAYNSSQYREVGRPDSLHVIFRHHGPLLGQIHLDTVSIAHARDRAGQIVYDDDLGTLIEHVRVDLKHQGCLFRCR